MVRRKGQRPEARGQREREPVAGSQVDEPDLPEDIDGVDVEEVQDGDARGDRARGTTDDPPKPRRSLAAMAAEAAGTASGICCPRCGCGHSRVTYTYDVGGARRRKRLCRNCGREFATTER